MDSIIGKLKELTDKVRTFLLEQWRKISELTGLKKGKPSTPVRGTTGQVNFKTNKQKPIRRRGRSKVYRLKGYTTVAKVNRKRQAEQQQRLLRRILLIVIIVIGLILTYNYLNPFRNISEWYRFFGIRSISEIISGTSATTTGTETTPITSDSSVDTTDTGESSSTTAD